MSALEDVIEESMKGLMAGLITKAEMEKQQYTQRVRSRPSSPQGKRSSDGEGGRSTLPSSSRRSSWSRSRSVPSLLSPSPPQRLNCVAQDFALLKADNERLLSELEKLKQRLREEITRTQASVRLDLNLEKGRIRDELGVRELKIREVDTRIEGEIGNLRTNMESVKFNMCASFPSPQRRVRTSLMSGSGAQIAVRRRYGRLERRALAGLHENVRFPVELPRWCRY